jgi:hypothetical protein
MDYKKIRDEVSTLSLDDLLVESYEWLNIVSDDESYEWFTQQRATLDLLGDTIAELGGRTDGPDVTAVRARLVGCCVKHRAAHHGKTPAMV